jgi:hypothetical protein
MLKDETEKKTYKNKNKNNKKNEEQNQNKRKFIKLGMKTKVRRKKERGEREEDRRLYLTTCVCKLKNLPRNFKRNRERSHLRVQEIDTPPQQDDSPNMLARVLHAPNIPLCLFSFVFAFVLVLNLIS